MYSHLNLDDIYDLMMEEEIMTAEISEHDAFISRSKIYNQFPDDKKEPSNHAKMPFLVKNTSNNKKFLLNVLITLLYPWDCLCHMTGFQPTGKFLHITLQSVQCMQVFQILKMDV